ncbi:MAG TPA: hypothetical protein VNN18_04710 [Candidatus Xenobia bacterium]|nr:hypothetical protein [Candidatus Xenobia bacterium]
MNWKRFALAVLAVLILNNIAGFVIHGMLLQADYAQYPNLLRTQEEAANYFQWMLLNFVVFSVAFVQGVEDKPWVGQGLRFGIAVWCLTSVAGFLTYYAVQPWRGEIVVKQILYELPRALALGLAAASIYRK